MFRTTALLTSTQCTVLFTVLGKPRAVYCRSNEEDEPGPSYPLLRRIPSKVREAFDKAVLDHKFYKIGIYTMPLVTGETQWVIVAQIYAPEQRRDQVSFQLVYPCEPENFDLYTQIISRARALVPEVSLWGGILGLGFFSRRTRLCKAIGELLRVLGEDGQGVEYMTGDIETLRKKKRNISTLDESEAETRVEPARLVS